MIVSEIPLNPDNQMFNIEIAGTRWRMSVIWREVWWVMNLADSSGNALINGIPLVTGVDLLAQYAWLGFHFQLSVSCDDSAQVYPGKTDLGIRSHLYVITE